MKLSWCNFFFFSLMLIQSTTSANSEERFDDQLRLRKGTAVGKTQILGRSTNTRFPDYRCSANEAVLVPQNVGNDPPKFYILKTTSDSKDGCANLTINDQGQPCLEKIINGLHTEPLVGLTREKIRASFGLPTVSGGKDKFLLVGWNGREWNRFCLDVKYKRGQCSQYRIAGPGITKQE